VSLSYTAAQLATRVSGELVGSADNCITGVAPLEVATADELSFLSGASYRKQLVKTKAGIVLVPRSFKDQPPGGVSWIYCDEPSREFGSIAAEYALPKPSFLPGIHPSAVVAESAVVADSAHIGPNAVVEAGAVIGERSIIQAGSYVGHNTTIGDDCQLFANVTVYFNCKLANRVILHSGVVIGADGFGYEWNGSEHGKINQEGIVRIDDDVEIGACTCVDRARFAVTWIKQGTKIDNQCQIGHNVVIGNCCIIVAQVGIAGSSQLGDGVVMAGKSAVIGHQNVAAGTVLASQSGIWQDVDEPGQTLMGLPAIPRKKMLRQIMASRELPDLLKRVRSLERELSELRNSESS
jgi:UDP-3-O-[3-hydroxymyristoyl] glucosamine N-acyltransferase